MSDLKVTFHVHINADKYKLSVFELLAQRAKKIGFYLEGETKKMINHVGAVSYGPRGGKSREASSPGSPPNKVTGTLQSNVGSETNSSGGQVTVTFGIRKGAADDYARALELGTSKMAARPFLRPTLINNKTRIMDILKGG